MKTLLQIAILFYFAGTVDAQTGIISTYAGNGAANPPRAGDGGSATAAVVPGGSGYGCLNKYGDMFFCQSNNHTVRKITASGIISTIAGTGSLGFSGDGGPATAAKFYYPNGCATDSFNNLYICDSRNNRIRRIDASTGNINTFAGNGTSVNSGDGGPATAATFSA
ncbi:MAG: hypothetical protein H7257_10900, partial [Taibaiella sp.]|nr:hypothetical protein [Taibaiella sp.]